jgi:hypothetical protein
MSFNHVAYRNRWLADPDNEFNNDHAVYGVEIHRMNGPRVWRVLGVHHLTPSENQGKHNIYVDVVGEDNQRYRGVDIPIKIAYTWIGRKANEANPDQPLDKPDNEPNGNVPLYAGMNTQVWIDGVLPSDTVFRLRSDLPEEKGPNGEIWNSFGHHSFYILFKLGSSLVVPPIDPPTDNGTSTEIQRIKAELTDFKMALQADHTINMNKLDKILKSIGG